MGRQDGIARWGQIGLAASAWLYAACIVIQVFLAGISVFDDASRWSDHTSFGQMIGILPLLVILFAVIGRVSVLSIVLSAAIFFLYGLQYAFANSDTGSVAALHAVNALVMFWLATMIAQQAQRLAFARRDA